jgi:hypothetical protein
MWAFDMGVFGAICWLLGEVAFQACAKDNGMEELRLTNPSDPLFKGHVLLCGLFLIPFSAGAGPLAWLLCATLAMGWAGELLEEPAPGVLPVRD